MYASKKKRCFSKHAMFSNQQNRVSLPVIFFHFQHPPCRKIKKKKINLLKKTRRKHSHPSTVVTLINVVTCKPFESNRKWCKVSQVAGANLSKRIVLKVLTFLLLARLTWFLYASKFTLFHANRHSKKGKLFR